jgi:alkanesulfonate monooxygenase SsuD/methylene tetrahydromethanopterin reductase-like flavin-dependent oxidoreductase (luciferase family)
VPRLVRAPVRFGLRLPALLTPAGGGLRQLLALARAGEEAGFDSLWVADRLDALRRRAADALEAYTLLGALAAATSTVRLGTLASPAGVRPPALLAKQVTTLDVISGGRAVLGLEARRGLATERYAHLEEAASVCRAMFEHAESTVHGRWFRTERAANRPGPVQPGGPAVLLAGRGGRLFLRAVARAGDAAHLEVRPSLLRRLAADLADEQRRAGRGERPLALSVTVEAPDAAFSVPAGADLGVAVTAVGRALAAGAHGVVLDVPCTARPEGLGRLGAALHDAFGAGDPGHGGDRGSPCPGEA